LRGAQIIRLINLRAFSFCEVLQKLGKLAKFAMPRGVTGLPSLVLGASASATCATAGGWLPAEFAPKTAAALPSNFVPGFLQKFELP
jgi:hypothetical protein